MRCYDETELSTKYGIINELERYQEIDKTQKVLKVLKVFGVCLLLLAGGVVLWMIKQ